VVRAGSIHAIRKNHEDTIGSLTLNPSAICGRQWI